MKIVKGGIFLIVFVVSILTLTAQEIRIRGNSMDDFYWNYAVVFNETDTVCVLKEYFHKQRIPNLKKEVYTIVFQSRFFDYAIVQADLREKELCKIKMPSYKYYSCSKSRESFFDVMTVQDTLRIFSITYGCFVGEPHPVYAIVTKQDSNYKFEYYKQDTLYSKIVNTMALQPLKDLEYERPIGIDTWKLSSGEGVYFELNKQVKIRKPLFGLYRIIEEM